MANNTTIVETVSWQKNEGRGTWDIISSCILTLVLCVWTALHLNVPKQNATLWDRFKTKTLWVIVGIFAPEMVVYIAWIQYSSAKYLLEKIQEFGADGTDLSKKRGTCGGSRGDSEDPSLAPTAPKRHKWTMSHCYFAGMGGFAFDSASDNDGQEFLPGSPSLRFTSHAVHMMARFDKLPDVSSAEISDKSKADGLAKALVCLQATWMLLQTVARLAAGLPITLLEINTIGHCFCALIIYLIWWNKPLHVLEPIVLKGLWMRRFTSYSYMQSDMHVESLGGVFDTQGQEGRDFRTSRAFRSEWERLHPVEWVDLSENQNSDVPESLTPRTAISRYSLSNDNLIFGCKKLSDNYTRAFPSNGLVLSEGEIIPGINLMIAPRVVDRLLATYYNAKHPNKKTPIQIRRAYPGHKFVVILTRMDIARWKLASDFIDSVQRQEDKYVIEKLAGAYVVTKVSDYSRSEHYALRADSEIEIGLALTAASAAYGGLHLSSWNAYFPTVVERWLWMSSSIFIAFAGSIPATIFLVYEGTRRFYKFIKWQYPEFCKKFHTVWSECIEWLQEVGVYSWARRIIAVTAMVCMGIGGVIYCFTRGFIIVEAFISLRKLPLAYYDTPVWSNLIPHL